MVVQGNRIRDQLVKDIQNQIQQISNELSTYLGEALKVELNFNSIQFPSFEFEDFDAQVKRQSEREQRFRKETRYKKRFCQPDETYEVDVPVTVELTFYEIDLRQILESIKQNIDANTFGTQAVVERIIKNQVSADFKSAEQQINDYIDRFQAEFDRLLRERETKEAEADKIRATLEAQKAGLKEYLCELTSIRASLDSWKPAQTVG